MSGAEKGSEEGASGGGGAREGGGGAGGGAPAAASSALVPFDPSSPFADVTKLKERMFTFRAKKERAAGAEGLKQRDADSDERRSQPEQPESVRCDE